MKRKEVEDIRRKIEDALKSGSFSDKPITLKSLSFDNAEMDVIDNDHINLALGKIKDME